MGTNCRQDSKYIKSDTRITLQGGAIGSGQFLLYIKYLAGTAVPSGCERTFREGHADIRTFLTSKKIYLCFQYQYDKSCLL
jgi:hypothetical protein